MNIVNALQKTLNDWTELHSKTRCEFYNNSFKKRLKDNNVEIYSTHNEAKFVVAERPIRTLKTKIYKYMTSASKCVYIDKLDDIVNEYNSTYHRTIKVKPSDSCKEVNDKDPKL